MAAEASSAGGIRDDRTRVHQRLDVSEPDGLLQDVLTARGDDHPRPGAIVLPCRISAATAKSLMRPFAHEPMKAWSTLIRSARDLTERPWCSRPPDPAGRPGVRGSRDRS